jgi:hypothetical protein
MFLIGCSKGYEKTDGKWTYVSHDEGAGKRVKYLNVDNATFKILENKDYAKDKNHVYLNGEQIRNADPKTFHYLSEDYSADKNNVFLDLETIINADPKTFKILDFPYSKDSKKIYCGTLPLMTSDIENFIVIKPGSMKNTELTASFINLNPKYSWIDTLKFSGVIYGDGEGRTKREKFDGYEKK